MKKSRTIAKPLISVILCTYNRGHLIGRAIRSVLNQTYGSWELIIVDDGSTDGSSPVLRTYARGDGRIRYTRHANRGPAGSRNVGIRMARGSWVTFLDSDDEYTPTHLSRGMRHVQRYRHLDAVLGVVKPIGPQRRQYVPDVDHPGRKIHVSRCNAAGTLLVRRSCLLRLRGFREISFSEDYDLICRLRDRFRVGRVTFPTYLSHVDADHRLCDLYDKQGVTGILRYREGAS